MLIGRLFDDMPMGTFVLGKPAETAGPAHKVALRYSSSLPFTVSFLSCTGLWLCLKAAAFKHNHNPVHERKLTVNGKDDEYLRATLWAGPAVSAGLPSTNVPIGMSSNNLPISMQITGPYLEDKTCLSKFYLPSKDLLSACL